MSDHDDKEPASAVRDAVIDAVNAVMRGEDGVVVIPGEAVIAGLVDATAFFTHRSPYVQTIRGRREYLEQIHEALKEQVLAYIAAAAAPSLETPKPKLLVVN